MRFRQTQRTNSKARLVAHHASGFTILQVVITLAVISIVSAFAILSLTSARASLRLQSSVRQLAGYVEKARLDAIRRHANSSVIFTDANTYSVKWISTVRELSPPELFPSRMALQLSVLLCRV